MEYLTVTTELVKGRWKISLPHHEIKQEISGNAERCMMICLINQLYPIAVLCQNNWLNATHIDNIRL